MLIYNKNTIIFPLNEGVTEDNFRYSVFNYICSERLEEKGNRFSEVLELYEQLKNIKWKKVGEWLEVHFLGETYKFGVI